MVSNFKLISYYEVWDTTDTTQWLPIYGAEISNLTGTTWKGGGEMLHSEIYLIGALLILIGAFTMLKSKNKKSVMIKKKLSSKKAPIGKKSVSKKK